MDDEFNVIAGEDDEVLHYPDDDEEREIETFVNETAGQNGNALAELNGLDRRPGKRRFCEMLEDDPTISHPLDWHLRMPLTLEERDSKRYRQLVEEEILDRITHKIVEARSRKSGSHSNGKMATDDQTEERVWGQILTMPPTDGSDWMGVSSDANDQRFYVRLFKEGKARKILKKIEKRDNLMYVFDNISKEVEKLRKNIETRREEEEQLAKSNSFLSPESGNSALWVDKYAPKGFADLVSDDEINRNLLTWLKLWDECVFRRKLNELDQLVDENKKEIFCLDSGKIRRPSNKILLLSGPAGLGKTTLAKIVARHAGYDTVEINGSDSRTVADFERVLEGAARSTRTISSNGKGRPSCLIIDEIDGAPAESVRHLIKAVQASGKKMLRRPIICICNNLFARSLRELRPIALSVLMTPPKEDRLVERFSQIACREEIRVDRTSLLRLVQLCSCDVRHALNALQYIAAATKQAHSCVTLKDIQEAVDAENLSNASIFDGWSTILEFSRHLDNKRMLHNEEKRIRAIQKYVAGEGNERFVTGLHSNYLRLSLPIKTLYRASNTFLFHDEISRVVSHTQNYIVMRYEIAFYAMLHLIIATHYKAHLKFPKFEQDMVQRHRESQDTLATVRGQLSGRRTVEEMVLDVLPFIVSIVQPQIKPMNEQLYGKGDREIIKGAVATMHGFGLTFAPTMISTQAHFIFQPRIDVLTLFDLSDVSHRNACPNSIRQMIARHIELYRVQSEINEESEKKQGNRAMQAVENARRMVETSPVCLYFHFNGNVSAAVRKNVRLFNVFP